MLKQASKLTLTVALAAMSLGASNSFAGVIAQPTKGYAPVCIPGGGCLPEPIVIPEGPVCPIPSPVAPRCFPGQHAAKGTDQNGCVNEWLCVPN